MITREILEKILEMAKQKGVREAEVIGSEGESRGAEMRNQEIEKISSSREVSLRLCFFRDGRRAEATTSDISPDTLQEFVEKTVEMLDFSDADAANGLVDLGEHPSQVQDLKLFDAEAVNLSLETQIDLARRLEAAAFAYDRRIKNSGGSSMQSFLGEVFYASSSGFFGSYKASDFSLGVEPIAAEGHEMQTGSWYASARFLKSLPVAETIGEKAALLAVRQLGGQKVKTCEAPVVMSPMAASEFIGTVRSAASGAQLYRKQSFLYGKLGKNIANKNVTLVDDPMLASGLGSRPFDGEGAQSRKIEVIKDGTLNSYLLDSYSGRKLGMKTTGAAGPSNFYLQPGKYSEDEIIASVKDGLYAVELIGFGVDLVNGTYSKGVRGMWIKDGKLAFPVEEITIAGNLMDMLQAIEMVGNNLEFFWPVTAPTIKIAVMTIAGS
ncbi:MAG: TldD/PmbA family protein [bacterium]|nr:TldD/PmbA family protein [bacterium]